MFGIFDKKGKKNTYESTVLAEKVVAFLEFFPFENKASFVMVKNQNNVNMYIFKQFFGSVPDTYMMYDANNKEIGKVTAKTGEILPGYEIELYGKSNFTVEKAIDPFDQSYMINNIPLVIDGDFFDLNYDIFSYEGDEIAEVKNTNNEGALVYVANKTYELEVICSAFCAVIGKRLI